jgi:hypothetical protein
VGKGKEQKALPPDSDVDHSSMVGLRESSAKPIRP